MANDAAYQKIAAGLRDAVDGRVVEHPPRQQETTPSVDHAYLRAQSSDGCCHKTRLRDAPCPIGWKCPYIKEASDAR